MRKIKIVSITAPGRDQGKKFYIKEMPAKVGEKWANRCFLALAASRTDLPAGLRSATGSGRGMRDVASIARMVGHISFPELEPLMDELMLCIRFLPDASDGKYKDPVDAFPFSIPLIDEGGDSDHIEEVSTRHFLRSEVLDLHTNFTLPSAILNLIAAGSTMTEIQQAPQAEVGRRSR
jgi:hypothetical protein